MKTVEVKGIIIGSGRPKIIVPLVGQTQAAIIEAANYLVSVDCDLVEWRVDFFEAVADTEQVIELSQKIREILDDKPLLFTFRTKQEGGKYPFTNDQYFHLYKEMIEKGALDLLDVELFMPETAVAEIIDAAHAKGIRIVMCNHDFDQTPSQAEIVARLRKMQEKHADICKIAVMPQNATDVVTLLAATDEMHTRYADRPLVTMSMGQLGMISRLSGEVFGSAMTFGAAKQASAPGQVPVASLRKTLALFSVTEQ
ncbi:type I 3-dehydroquinate dehydratase [Enterococcus faecalis]